MSSRCTTTSRDSQKPAENESHTREDHVCREEIMKTKIEPEPWLRGTLTNVPAVVRAVLHAQELAREDVERWTEDLTEAELNARELGLPSVGQQVRHISRSVDRLL